MEKLRDINPAHERFGYLSLVVAGAVVLAIGLLVRSDLFVKGGAMKDHRGGEKLYHLAPLFSINVRANC